MDWKRWHDAMRCVYWALDALALLMRTGIERWATVLAYWLTEYTRVAPGMGI